MTDDSRPLETYSPAAVLSLYDQALHNPKRAPFVLEGVLRLGTGQVYRDGYSYDRLEDRQAGAKLTVRLPAAIRAQCEDGKAVVLRGYLEPRLKSDGGLIELHFVAMELLGQGQTVADPVQERRLEVLVQRLERPVKSADNLIRARLLGGQRVRVALILGVTAVVGEDLRQALGSSLSKFDLLERRVSLHHAGHLAAAIQDADHQLETDLIAVIRGGGSGLEVFEDPELAEAVLDLESPLVVALGHAVDRPLLAKVADASLETPSALGAHWRRIAEEVARAEGLTLEALRRRTEAPLLARIEWLERSVKRWVLVAAGCGVLGAVIGVLVASAFRR